jgi:hypothetical protein
MAERFVVLADVSATMDCADAGANGSERRIDALRRGLAAALGEQGRTTIVAFTHRAWVAERPEDLPEPDGGTCLASAVRLARRFAPTRTLLISDGTPYSEAEAFAERERLPGRIDVLYCGPDRNHEAIDFMRRFARGGTMTQGRDEDAITRAARAGGSGNGLFDPAGEIEAMLGRAGERAQVMAHLPKLAAGLEQLRGQVHTLATDAQIAKAERLLDGVVDKTALGWMERLEQFSAATALQRDREAGNLRHALQVLGDKASGGVGSGFAALSESLSGQMNGGLGDPRLLPSFDFKAFVQQAPAPAPLPAPTAPEAARLPGPKQAPAAPALPNPASPVSPAPAARPQLPARTERRGLLALMSGGRRRQG